MSNRIAHLGCQIEVGRNRQAEVVVITNEPVNEIPKADSVNVFFPALFQLSQENTRTLTGIVGAAVFCLKIREIGANLAVAEGQGPRHSIVKDQE